MYDSCTISSYIMPYFGHTYLIGERMTETLLLFWTRASCSALLIGCSRGDVPPLRQSCFTHYGIGSRSSKNSTCNIGYIIAFLQKRSRVPGWHSSEYWWGMFDDHENAKKHRADAKTTYAIKTGFDVLTIEGWLTNRKLTTRLYWN